MHMYLWPKSMQPRVLFSNGSEAILAAALFGPGMTPMEAGVGMADPPLACEPLANNLTGKIAVVDRGTCMDVVKVLHAQKVRVAQGASGQLRAAGLRDHAQGLGACKQSSSRLVCEQPRSL